MLIIILKVRIYVVDYSVVFVFSIWYSLLYLIACSAEHSSLVNNEKPNIYFLCHRKVGVVNSVFFFVIRRVKLLYLNSILFIFHSPFVILFFSDIIWLSLYSWSYVANFLSLHFWSVSLSIFEEKNSLEISWASLSLSSFSTVPPFFYILITYCSSFFYSHTFRPILHYIME